MHKHDFSLNHLPKSYLVDHLRVPHDVGKRVTYLAEERSALQKWPVDQLRRAHQEMHP